MKKITFLLALFCALFINSNYIQAQTVGNMPFGTGTVVLDSGTNPSAAESTNSLLNNFNVSGTSSGSIFLAFALSGNEAGTDAIGSGSDAVLGWIGNGTTSVSSGTLTNDGGSEFGITGMDFAYKQALGGATSNFTIEGKKDGSTVGTVVLTTPTHNSAIAIDFTSPTTGSFADIDELVITPASPLFGGFSVDDMVIVAAAVACAAPTAQATSASFGTETSSTLTLNSFTAPAGGADGYVIIMTTDNTFTAPTDGALLPPSDNNWNDTGDQVVFSGTSNAGVTVTGLDINTQYFFRVYSYNDCSGTNTFETTGLSANDTTAKGSLTVTANSGLSKVYGATDPTLTYTITGFEGGDNEASLDTPVSISRASGENVANYVVTPASAADADYNISFVTSTFGITQAALTVTANSGLSKVYGATDPTLTYTITGFVNGDVEGDLDTPVSISRASGENVANYVVTPASAADTNYSVSFVTTTFGITQAALTVTANSGLSKVYGATDPTLTYTITGFVNGDVEGDLDTPVSISRASGENVANYVVTPASATDTNYSVSFVTTTFGITQAALTVTADSGLSKVYGATDPTLTYTITGFVNGDVEGDLDTPVSISRASGENVANYVVTPSSAADTNYSVSFVTTTFGITQAALTVTANSGLSKVYGATDPTLTYTITGFVNGDVEGDLDTPVSISRASGENVANYVVTPASAADTNYSVSFVTTTFGITAAALTVTADSGLSKVYGATDPTLTYTITGFVNGDVEGDLDTPVSISRASGENVANYVVTPASAADTNYSVSFVTSTFGITQAALTVTADSGLSKVFGATDPTLTYTITGFVNGDVEGDLDTPVSISRAAGEAIANYVVTPASAADTNYSVSFVTSTFAITQATLTITANSGLSKVYGATDPTLTYTITGFQGGDTEADLDTPVTISRASGENVANYVITPAGATDSNYLINFVTSTFGITQAALTVTANSGLSKVYGATDPTLTYTITGFVNGDVEGDLDTPVSISRASGENVANYVVTPASAADTNYSVSFVTTTFGITQAALTVTANSGLSKVYGATDPTLTYTITGFVNGDVEGDLDTPVSISRASGENVANYVVTPADAADTNYSVSFVTTTFGITQAALTVTADSGLSKVYGATDPTLTYTITGFVNGDVEGDLDTPVSISRASGENVANYVVTPSSAADTNYSVSFVTTTFGITQAALTVTANSGLSKVYGATDPTLTYTITGFVNGDVEGDLDTPVSISRASGENVANYVVTPADATDSNYSVSFVTTTFGITAAALTVTADSGLSKVYGATDPTLTYTITGFVNGDVEGDLDTPVSISRASGENVANYVVTPASAADTNYSVSFVTSTFGITQAALTVTADSGLSKVFGATDPTLTYTITGFVNGDVEGDLDTPVSISRAAGEAIANYVVTPASAADSNYSVSFVTTTFAITQATLTITANSGLSKVYGATDPTLTYTITGFQGGDTEADLDTPVTISRASGENVANYVITPAGATDSNYLINFVTSTFGITQAALTVTANSGLSKVYGATDPTLTYTITGFVNGDVEGDLDTPVSISRASGENVANYVVTPADATDSNYSVSFVTSTFGITQAALTVTANSGLSKVYGATDPTLTYTITGFVNGDVEGDLDTPVSISRASGENVANYVVTPASAADTNYSVSFVTTTFGITAAALTVTADSGLSKVYGATDPTLTYTITGFVNGDVEGDLDTPVSISRASGENVANYVVTPADAADTNYSVSFVTSTFGITQAALTVTADSGLSKVYGATDPTLTYTITGFVNGDVEGDLDTPVSISRASGENVANYVVTPADAADTNYSVSFVTSTFGITQAALTVTADSGLSKVYGATDPTLTYTITGFVNGDVEGDLDTPVSISRASGENVANYVVTPADAADTNYSVSFVTTTFGITQAALTVTANSGLSKVYGATDPTLTYTITGFVNGDVEGDLDTPVSISRASGENVANYVVTPADAADTNYSVSFVTNTFAITQAALTVTANSGLSKVYGATDPTLTYTITGFVNGDVEGDLDTPVSISRASGENVANYVVTPASAADTNYSVSFVTTTFGITAAALTVTADSGLSKVYGATDPTLTYTITGFVNGDVEGDLDTPVSISRASGENVANYVVTPSSAADTNYSVSFVTSTFAITQAALTVTADSGLSKVYGATDPTLTYTITGFVNGDVEGDLDTPVSISRASGENVANYVVTPADAADTNYSVSFVTSTFAITQAALTVTADSGLSKVYGATDPTLTFTITGFVNGDVEGDLDTPVSISRASGENVANYVVTPADAADTNYSVIFVTTTFAITQAALTVTADSGLSKVYGTTDPTLTYTITGFVNGDVEGDLDTPVSISRASGENVANYVVTPSSAADTNYSVSFVTSTFAITQAALTVTADSGLSKVYGATDPTLTYTITGFVNGDVEGDLDTPVSISRASGENVANYVVTPADAADTNYSVSFVTSTFAITQAALTVTADSGLSKVYGATDPTLTYTITGFVNGDVEGDLDTPVSISRASGENVANYVVTPADAADSNYSVSFVTSTFAITQAALTVTADSGLSKVYGTTDPTLTYTITGFVGADNEASLDTPVSISRASGENVANYVVTPADAADTNYSVIFVTTTFAITQAALTVTADSGLSKVYGATDPTLTYTITGFVNGDVEGDLDTPVSISRASGENVANYVVTPADAADTNYSVSFVTTTFAITQAGLTITGITGDNKIYDGTTVATVSGTATLSGVVGADVVTVAGSPIHNFATSNIGTSITITTTGYTISGANAANYTVSQPNLTADITAKALTVTGLTGDDKMYDGTTVATASGTPVLSGIEGADAVALGGTPVYTFASPNPGTGITITTTGYTISGADNGNYTVTQPTLSADILGPTISFNTTSSSALENIGSANLTVDLSVAVPITVTVDYAVTGGTASGSGVDYTLASGTLTFNPNTSSGDIALSIADELMVEPDETVIVTISNPTNGSLGINTSHTFTITNDDTTVVTIADISANENAGTQNIIATLSNPVQGGFAFDVFTTDGTGTTADSDYSSTGGSTLTFAGTAGETQMLQLGGLGDTKVEADETFAISMTNVGFTSVNPANIDITSVATYTILNDDSAAITISDISGNEDDGVLTLTATLDNPVDGGFNVNIDFTDGTATTADSDYTTASPVVLTFAGNMGETQTFTVTPTADTKVEADETLFIGLSNLIAPLVDNLDVSTSDGANVTILNDDTAAVTIADVSANEDDGSITVTATLDNAVQGGFTVDVNTTDGTATTADSDYTAVTSETLTFAGTAGETQTFTIIPTADTKVEVNETLNISMGNLVAGAGFDIDITDDATVTINNDDSAAVTIEDVSGNEDDGTVTITVALDNAVQGGFTVDVNTLDTTATVADGDYTAVTGQILTFAGSAGETQTFTVTPTTDNKVEEDEIVTIGMTTIDNTPSFGDISITDTASYTILNDDSATVTILADVLVDENAGNAILTATLDNPVQGGFFIHVTTADGTAVAPGDYTASNDDANTDFSGTAGETQNLFIPIIDDSQGELSETFTVTLSSVSGTTLGSFITTVDGATVTILDDDAPVVSGVAVPTDGLYGIGDDLDFTVTFTDFVTTTGTPVIPITIGSTTVNAELSAPVANSLTAVFRYTVVEGDLDVDGIAVGTDIDLNGGTIIGTNSAIDAILTLNSVGSTANVNVDGVRPIPLITSAVPDPTNTFFDITITFDEVVTDFTDAGIDVGNGTVTALTGTGTTYTATITPAADGIVNIIVLDEAAFDPAGNGNVVSNEFSVEYDATNPVATITTMAPDPVNVPFDIDIEWSEDVFGFVEADLVVTNGTPSGFIVNSATSYTVTITPSGAGDVIVDIPAMVTEDLATNPNDAATFSIEYDNIPPLPPQITHISDYTCAGDVSQTGDSTLEISGTAERNSTVEMFIDGISIGTIVTDANTGFFTFDYSGTTLADGTYTFTAQATDIAMNTGALSNPFAITVNTVDSDGDGDPDFCDDDDDGNGSVDADEDCDGDGIIDSQDTDNSSCGNAILETKTYGFSPNGDGVNDGWFIEGITAYPNSLVQVFNRSGKIVFKQKGYQNDWTGISNQVSGGSLSNRLPVGPYLFIVDLGNGTQPTRGWLYINY